MAPKKMIMPKSLPNKNDMYSPIELNSKKNPLNSLKNLIISFIVIALSYLGAKIVQIEQKTKFNLSFFERLRVGERSSGMMQPIFELLRSNIRISPQTTKDLRGKVRLIVY